MVPSPFLSPPTPSFLRRRLREAVQATETGNERGLLLSWVDIFLSVCCGLSETQAFHH